MTEVLNCTNVPISVRC